METSPKNKQKTNTLYEKLKSKTKEQDSKTERNEETEIQLTQSIQGDLSQFKTFAGYQITSRILGGTSLCMHLNDL
ncbi:Hypothetical predicted protein [Mytilus galloprovincialis]|uniref:Uncharacterized protein n=1 Tax=Mytilus galloprovincialis TaxID=29158 RepID=A0A8B6G8N2_MYTGA|nr:Hypothetical predicted protein [Mytilus galloprovincialis]